MVEHLHKIFEKPQQLFKF